MNTTLQNSATLAGRVGLGLLFVVSGFGKSTGFAGTAGCMASKGMPMAEAQAQVTQFLENLSILGGMLNVAAFGPGAWSVDRR